MGFLSSIKRLFFTTESIAKSAADKAVEFTKEKASEVASAANEAISDVSEKTAGLREAVVEKTNAALEKVETVAESAWEKTKDFTEDAVDKVKEMTSDKEETINTEGSSTNVNVELVEPVKTPTVSEESTSFLDKVASTGANLLDKTKEAASSAYDALADNETVKKAGEIAENIGAKVMEKGNDLAEKAADITENVGSKVADASSIAMEKLGEAKDAAVEKAKEVSEQIGKKFDETVDKAEKFMAEENAKPKQEFSDKDLNASGSLLGEKDDFFAKADKYANGDFDAFSEGKITVQDAPKVSKENDDTLDLIDDAIVVDDNEPQK